MFYMVMLLVLMLHLVRIYLDVVIFLLIRMVSKDQIFGKDIHCVIVAKDSIIPLGSSQITAQVANYGPGSVWTNSADYLYGN